MRYSARSPRWFIKSLTSKSALSLRKHLMIDIHEGTAPFSKTQTSNPAHLSFF